MQWPGSWHARLGVALARACLAALLPATVFAKTLGTTRVIARGGDLSPDGTGSLFEIVSPIVLGSSGRVAFSSDIRDQGFLDGFGIFRFSDATDLTLIARSSASGSGPVAGWPAPDGDGYFYPFDAPHFAINGSGAVAFGARLTGTLDPTANEGVFVGSGGQAGLVHPATSCRMPVWSRASISRVERRRRARGPAASTQTARWRIA